MSEDEQISQLTAKKLSELVNLNTGLKGLFKELIEIVASKLEKVNSSLNQLKEEYSGIKELENRIIGIEETLKNMSTFPVGSPKPDMVKTPKPKTPVPAEEELADIDVAVKSKFEYATPSKGPVDDIFRSMLALLQSEISGEDLAKEFEASRDRLMEHHSFHPVYHEIARVINTLRKYKESRLTKKDVEELGKQIDKWRERMLS